MSGVLPRYSQIILASALALTAFGTAPVLSASPRDPATGLPSGKRMHKPYTLSEQPTCDTHLAGPTNGVASDPEEGGQVTAADKTSDKGKVQINDLHVTKQVDKSSNTLMEHATGCGSGQH